MNEAWVVKRLTAHSVFPYRPTRFDRAARPGNPDSQRRHRRSPRRSTDRRSAATALKWAEGYRVDNVTVVASIEHWDLGLGESQVIAHSVGAPRWAVLDDRAARRCAVAHGIPVIGSLGVVLRAKKNLHVDRARPLVQELIAAGMFLEDKFVDRVLESIGE